jgi:AraC family transcriptional regulator, arabinose operon regulatory protein
MDEFFIHEEHSPLITGGLEFDLAVTAVGHVKHPFGPVLSPEISSYAALVWCLEGELEIIIDDISFQFKESEVFILPPGVKYHTHVKSEVSALMFFALEGKKAWDTVHDMKLWEGIFFGGEAPEKLFDYLMKNISKVDPKFLGINLNVARDLLAYVSKNNRNHEKDKFALDIETLIRQKWNKPGLSVNYIVGELNLHRTTVSEKFKKRTGMTIIEYLNNIRLTEAKRHLQNTTLQINEISRLCGYTDPLYFSRIFKKNEKTSPKKFRSERV